MEFNILKGKTLTEIIGKCGDEEVVFITNEGQKFVLYYEHD